MTYRVRHYRQWYTEYRFVTSTEHETLESAMEASRAWLAKETGRIDIVLIEEKLIYSKTNGATVEYPTAPR